MKEMLKERTTLARDIAVKAATTAFALGAMACTALPCAAQSQEGPWIVRVRAVNLDSANKDSTGLGLSINNKVLPELDISYLITPSFATELILTYPQKQKVRSNGTEIGTLKHLPPTLTGLYRINGLGGFTPYFGGGVNYTRFSDVKLPTGVSIEKDSFGLALQAGVDIPLMQNLSLNVDVKKVKLQTDVMAGGNKIGTLKIDPVLFGVGLGWRF